ncbi:uncharacterized protein (DUF885 family) [Kitasatospora sp. MAA19]|uniref:DUF885 domain-containing protein n=1 Tax=Kitasatospora sp. MAA19 TaxID=3035090 RepID=UPI002476F62F|nr:DUF885 domain-containing protein [Kitasatospora sp. MAA19]MDH6708475.1 uncharacterized protein (DUF885 family) [Kitasatospora sp. MAA19]
MTDQPHQDGPTAPATPAASATSAALAALATEFFAAENSYAPFDATLSGVEGYAHEVPDPSREAALRHREVLAGFRARLAALPVDALTGDDQVTHRVLGRLIDNGTGQITHGLADFSVSATITAPQNEAFTSLIMTSVDHEGADSYLERLAGLPGYFDAVLQRFLDTAAAGRRPLRSGVDAAITQLDAYLATGPADDQLLRPLQGRPEAERAGVIVRDGVRPAVARYRAGLAQRLSADARPDDEAGVCHVPGGVEGYADAVTRFTRPGLTPEEVHRIGLDTLAVLREEFAELGGKVLGITGPEAVLAALREDRTLRFDSAGEIIALVDDALERARRASADYFRSYPIVDCVTREIDPIEAETAPLAYYQPPGPGGLPGTHWINTLRPQTRFRYEYEAIAFHESVPGHHLQIAVAQTLHHLPEFRRRPNSQLTAHVEGWGLYTERLADEMGLYSSDLSRFGMLSLDALRAVRLVVDTGLHHYGWSRERAIAFMRDNTATTEANVRNEIDRYIAWPGQATAYLIGRRELVRHRERAQAALGGRFDIREFHHQLIGHGSLPLGVLDELVSDWIAAQ